MKYLVGWVGAALLLGGMAHAEAAPPRESGLEQSADALLVGIPVAAFGLTFLIQADAMPLGFDVMNMTGTPRHDLALALGRAGAVTYGLKYTVEEQRPNGEEGSFPSGHTAISFAGAEFIRKEYGWRWGAPAYAAATFVGWSRVATDDHWWHDVVAGGAIGVLSNYDLGQMDTRWGGLSLHPALLHGGVQVAPNAPEVPVAAPGLRIEFRF
jgi:membrane-associated phospholipid phosphatase